VNHIHDVIGNQLALVFPDDVGQSTASGSQESHQTCQTDQQKDMVQGGRFVWGAYPCSNGIHNQLDQVEGQQRQKRLYRYESQTRCRPYPGTIPDQNKGAVQLHQSTDFLKITNFQDHTRLSL
jgi:hypothetical protein